MYCADSGTASLTFDVNDALEPHLPRKDFLGGLSVSPSLSRRSLWKPFVFLQVSLEEKHSQLFFWQQSPLVLNC